MLFTLFVFVCVKWCQTHIMLWFGLVCLSSPMLTVCLDCPFVLPFGILCLFRFESADIISF